jgi:predicted PurR-regulated permease PerM
MADQATRRVYRGIVFGVALVGGIILVVLLRQIVLLAFLGATIAVLLQWLAGLLRRLVPRLCQGVALAIVIIVLAAVVFGLANVIARPIAKELSQLAANLERHFGTLQERFEAWSEAHLESGAPVDLSGIAKEVFKSTQSVVRFMFRLVSVTGNVLLKLFVVLSLGVFFSVTPSRYNDLLLRYVSEPSRQRVRRVLDQIVARLRGWLGGTLFSALFIAVFATLGLLLIGVRYPHVFGLLAGLMAFIPYFGSIMAVVPPALFALLDPHPIKALWVVILFVSVQTIEANVFTPMVMQRRVQLPPAVVVLAVMAMGALLGFLGAVLALPLTLSVQAVLDEFVAKKRAASAA